MDGVPDLAAELRRRLLVRRDDLARMGVPDGGVPVAGHWLADPAHWAGLRGRLVDEVDRHAREHPLEPGAPVEALRHRLGLPDRSLVEALVRPPLAVRGGRVRRGAPDVPGELVTAVERAFDGLAVRPFAAPEAYRLPELGLGSRQLGAAVRAGPGGAAGRQRDRARAALRSGRSPCSPRCPSRSRSARPDGPWTPAAGSRCRCWSCWTAWARPAGCPMTAASSRADPARRCAPRARPLSVVNSLVSPRWKSAGRGTGVAHLARGRPSR